MASSSRDGEFVPFSGTANRLGPDGEVVRLPPATVVDGQQPDEAVIAVTDEESVEEEDLYIPLAATIEGISRIEQCSVVA
eukprot:2774102-Pyramimonas_sp.AAC.1